MSSKLPIRQTTYLISKLMYLTAVLNIFKYNHTIASKNGLERIILAWYE